MKSFVWSMLTYGSETWTVRKYEEDELKAAEMWTWRKNNQTERKSNEIVLEGIGERRVFNERVLEKRRTD